VRDRRSPGGGSFASVQRQLELIAERLVSIRDGTP
jgi:hypothetical protein